MGPWVSKGSQGKQAHNFLHIWFSDQPRLYARRDALEKGIKFFVVFVLECAHLQQIWCMQAISKVRCSKKGSVSRECGHERVVLRLPPAGPLLGAARRAPRPWPHWPRRAPRPAVLALS